MERAALSLVASRAQKTDAFRWVEIGRESGLTLPNTFGGKEKKDLILESTGTGVAIFDFDGDGAEDIFLPNGRLLDSSSPAPLPQLYRNDGTGHFTDSAKESGLTRTGWAQAACAGDLNNTGRADLLVTY